MPTVKEPAKKEVRKPAAAAAAHPVVTHQAAAHPAHPAARAAHPHPTAAPTAKAARYTEATGRRKTAVARVRLVVGHGKFLINGKEPKSYFTLPRLVAAAMIPLEHLQLAKNFDVTVKVAGGGISAQAEAVRHGLARALVLVDAAWKPRLRAMGYMTRDSRMVERKKYGLKKARRAPQWAKR